MQTKESHDTLRAREMMVKSQIEARGVRDPRLLAMLRVLPRHLFVPVEERLHAYDDSALPIGRDATISQPVITANITEALKLDGTEKILEIGTGSGYQTALLCELGGTVYSMEIDEVLAERAAELLQRLGYRDRLFLKTGDGMEGWRSEAPFDRIVLTAAPASLPDALMQQLADGGRLVAPVGPPMRQRLLLLEKNGAEVRKTDLGPVRFVTVRKF